MECLQYKLMAEWISYSIGVLNLVINGMPSILWKEKYMFTVVIEF